MSSIVHTKASRLRGFLGVGDSSISNASLAAFRILFGAAMCIGTVRFMLEGWVHEQYVRPTFFFKFFGFSWVRVWSEAGLYLHFSLMALCAALVSIGLFYRVAVVGFTLLFAYVELMDVTNYLNHYMLVIWLSLLMCLAPLHKRFSIDAKLFPKTRTETISSFWLWTFRVQIAVVYFSAAWAKVGTDWLVYGQPLGIWLHARTETPLIGWLFELPYVPLVMSWSGFLYDALIVFALLAARTRLFAYIAVVVFHCSTSILFDIGMFPAIMIIATLVFFRPDWPTHLLHLLQKNTSARPPENLVDSPVPPRWTKILVSVFLCFQILWPFRSVVYGSDVLWHEQGMRFAWKVMVREKSGSITYRAQRRASEKVWHISPSEYLTGRQANEMSGQPDLILQLAKHIAWDFEQKGRGPVSVYVDALVSLNGRSPSPIIDPNIDLTTVTDGFGRASWILPAPTTPPLGGTQ